VDIDRSFIRVYRSLLVVIDRGCEVECDERNEDRRKEGIAFG
jgi:hypothetical protein